MKMKERFHAICRFLTMVSQGNHRVLFWLLGSAFAAATLPYLSLFFSARILNLLLAKSYRACLYTVVVFLLTQYGLGLFEKICRQYLDGQKELCLARTEQKITAKALELEFEKFEKTETMDAIRRTNVSSMGSGNVGDQLIVIHTLITSLLSVLYALFFLLRLFLLSDSSRNNFFTSPFSMLALLLLCGVQLALSSRINRRSTQKKIELNQGNDHSNSVANYLVNVMLEERRADDIRIGHLDHFLDVQFGKAMEHFLPMYLDFARFSAITDGKNALLSLLSNFAAYLVIGARALYGVLPIGDVLLYAGSVTRAMSDLQTFLATGSEFDYINSYLSTYEDFIAQPSMAYDGTLPIEKRDDEESDSTSARMYWFLIASSRMRSRSRNCEVTVSAACRTSPSVWMCIMSEPPLREMAPSTRPPSSEKTGAPALLILRACAEYIRSPGRNTGTRSSSDRPMAHVPMSRSVQR